MSDSGENGKYKWTPESTSLLVSVWSDKQVQKQLKYAPKSQLIWESVARYMKKKGYNASGKQCRSRMKQVLVCYREAKRAGTRAGVEQYYESIDRVLETRRFEETNINGIDTVDATAHVKSPPKDVKTARNLQMRHKDQEPVRSMYRTEALSPTWIPGRENEYPDSPESNETIIARPHGLLSPTRDVAINTSEQPTKLTGKQMQCNSCNPEEPVCANYKKNLIASYPCGEIPFQNTVQNVQNQIIQDSMQQYHNLQQNRLWNQQNVLANELGVQQNLHNLRQSLAAQSAAAPVQTNGLHLQNLNYENLILQQNQLQQNIHNRAMPQEPRKFIYGQNLAATYRNNQNALAHEHYSSNNKPAGSSSPDYSPDVSQNLNDAFCQSTKSEGKVHNLNETFNQPRQAGNQGMFQNPEVSVITNNATCNDDSLLLDMFLDSPIPSDNGSKSKDTAVNTEEVPNVPLRKKKVQKLEQLVLSAINSQNEVVNKILSAQNDMVSKFLDVDRDRQNRLENRLDDLLKVVHATVLNKTPESDSDAPSAPPEPTIRSLGPPPRPGTFPPKLDLVPPKPCRVPCTIANSNVELINQNPVNTRPGIVSPIMSPSKKPGAIWSKLGPVSQSPFMKAQQRLGIHAISNTDVRTRSSAERRIAQEINKLHMDAAAIMFETGKFLEMERLLEEKIRNAYYEMKMEQTARRRLFVQREPTPAMILTKAFLEAESRFSEENLEPYKGGYTKKKSMGQTSNDDMLTGQGESYDRLRNLNIQSDYVISDPCETSTPAKAYQKVNNNEDFNPLPKQTIQQLGRLVMNSARWRDAAQNQHRNIGQTVQTNLQKNENTVPVNRNDMYAISQRHTDQQQHQQQQVQGNPPNTRTRPSENFRNRYTVRTNEENSQYPRTEVNEISSKPKYPMGFTTAMMNIEVPKEKESNEFPKTIGFVNNIIPERKQQTVRFMDEALADLHRMYIEKITAMQQEQNDSLPYVAGTGAPLTAQNRQMIEKYINDIMPRKQLKEKDTDSDEEEFLDTTATMPTSVISRRGSLTSSGTGSTETAHSLKFKSENCVIC